MLGRRILLCVFPVFLSLNGCTTISTVPFRSAPDSSGIGLSVKIINSMIVPVTYNADVVYFSKRCEYAESCDPIIYISSYAKDGRMYWLDVPPGEYVAVAASFRQFADPNNYITYFPDQVIKKTTVRVEAAKFNYLGDYILDMSLGVCPDKADSSQLHYAEVFAPGVAKCGFLKIIGERLASTPVMFIGNQAYAVGGGDYHYRGEIRQAGWDEGLRNDFIARAKQDLKGKGWDPLLEQY